MNKHDLNYTVFTPKSAPATQGSWWLGLDRPEFYRPARLEQDRLSASSKASKIVSVAVDQEP